MIVDFNRFEFALRFDRPPNFERIDQSGRQFDSFQGYVFLDPATPIDATTETLSSNFIIRGSEIQDSGEVRVRRNERVRGKEGWGPAVASVPYRLKENWVSFSIPRNVFSTNSEQLRVSFHVVRNGELVQVVRPEQITPNSERPNTGLRVMPDTSTSK